MLDGLLRQRVLMLAPAGAALFVRPRWQRSNWSLLARGPLSAADWNDGQKLGARLFALAQEGRLTRAPMQVMVSDRLCRTFMVTPPPNAARMADLKAAAAARYARLFGSGIGWQIDAQWNPAKPFIASAMPMTISSALDSLQIKTGLAAVRVQPHFIEASNDLRTQITDGDWFGVVEGKHMTMAAVKSSAFSAVRATQLPSEVFESADALSRFVKQEVLRLDVELPTLLKLSGDVPAVWVSRAPTRSGCVHLDRNVAQRSSALLAIAEGKT
jgi:hypothetical protein